MGYMVHHAIVVTSWDFELIEEAHAKAADIFGGRGLVCVVSPVMETAINGDFTFLVGPDGSKEGWDTSADGDHCRAEFVAWLRSKAYDDGSSALSWALIQYGDDNDDNRMLAHDADARGVVR